MIRLKKQQFSEVSESFGDPQRWCTNRWSFWSQLHTRSDTFSCWIPWKVSCYHSLIQPRRQHRFQDGCSHFVSFSFFYISLCSHYRDFCNYFFVNRKFPEAKKKKVCVKKIFLNLFLTCARMSSASEADFRCTHGDTICGEFLSEEGH